MRTRIPHVAALALAGSLLLAACGSSSESSSTTTTTGPNQTFQVQTDEGQASLSLDGRLPPGWPSGFPVPSGAKAAGSGSLAGKEQGVKVGVYTTSKAPQDVYDFYKTNASLTIGSQRSVGVGSRFVGNLELKGTYTGSVTIVSLDGTTTIVVVLTNGSATTSTTQ